MCDVCVYGLCVFQWCHSLSVIFDCLYPNYMYILLRVSFVYIREMSTLLSFISPSAMSHYMSTGRSLKDPRL